MSIESWKNEFYPITAENIAAGYWSGDEVNVEIAMISHSLNKWIGLLPENLEKHSLISDMHSHKIREKVKHSEGIVVSSENPEVISVEAFAISATNCSLCQRYLDYRFNGHVCKECPLFIARGGVACDDRTTEEKENGKKSPWNEFTTKSSPFEMIEVLKRALQLAESKKKDLS